MFNSYPLISPRRAERRASHSLLILALGLLCISRGRADVWYRDAVIAPMSQASFEKIEPHGVFKLGPVLVDASASAFFDYSDNVLLSAVGLPGSHVGGGVSLDAVWAAAKAQQVKFSAELGRRQTLSGPGRSRQYLTISPGSALRYTSYVKDIRITPFLNLSRQEDPLLSPTVNNTDTYRVTTYDLGLQVDVPLHRFTGQLMALEGLRVAGSDVGPNQETNRSVQSLRLIHNFSSSLEGGVDYNWVTQDYRRGPASSSTTATSSAFVDWALSKAIQLKAAAGVSRVNFANPVAKDDTLSNTSLYSDLSVTHRVRKNFKYTVKFGESVGDGVSSNFTKMRDLSISPHFTLSVHLTLELYSGWQQIAESTLSGEDGRRRTYQARLDWILPHNVTVRVTARDVEKTSSIPARGYAQRFVEVNVRKQF